MFMQMGFSKEIETGATNGFSTIEEAVPWQLHQQELREQQEQQLLLQEQHKQRMQKRQEQQQQLQQQQQQQEEYDGRSYDYVYYDKKRSTIFL